VLNGIFQIFWSGSGTLVTIISEDSYYVLRFDRDAYNEKIEAGADLGDEGVEEAFDLVAEISEKYIIHFPNPIGHD
jgi:coatomer subunit beta'